MEQYRPFRQTEEVVDESFYRRIHGYPNLVVKSYKVEEQPFQSLDQVRDAILFEQKAEETVKKLGSIVNSSVGEVPESSYVIHADPSGLPTFSQVQQRIHGQTLEEVGTSVFGYPVATLTQLRNLFQATIKHWKHEKTVIDVVGSAQRKNSRVKRLFERLIPLSHARNIMVDQENNVQLVDVKPYVKVSNPPLEIRIKHSAELAGSYISVGMLNTAIGLKRILQSN